MLYIFPARRFPTSGKTPWRRAARHALAARAGACGDIAISDLYVYRRDFLLKFARLRPTALERIESLEQLRALENGYRIYVAEVDERSIEVDTPADLRNAARYWTARAQLRGNAWRR